MINAPVIYIISVAAIGFVIWLFVKAHFAQQINAMTATIAHKDSVLTDYRDRLNGATPVEVATEIVNLKSEIASLRNKVARPQRIITSEQKARITTLAASSGLAGHQLFVCATPDTESNRYAKQIVSALKEAGIECQYTAMGTHDDGESGVIMYSPENPVDFLFPKVGEIFTEAAIPFVNAVGEKELNFHYIFVCPEEA